MTYGSVKKVNFNDYSRKKSVGKTKRKIDVATPAGPLMISQGPKSTIPTKRDRLYGTKI